MFYNRSRFSSHRLLLGTVKQETATSHNSEAVKNLEKVVTEKATDEKSRTCGLVVICRCCGSDGPAGIGIHGRLE